MSKLILQNKISDYIIELSLNRPEKLNALTKPMWKELGSVFKKLSNNKNLRCIIIRGKGGKSFHQAMTLVNLKQKDQIANNQKIMENSYIQHLRLY